MGISKGVVKSALKVCIYGPEGIGKSTFASKFPKAVFEDTEGGTKQMDVARFDPPSEWISIFEDIKYARLHPEEVGTFVLDTADWAEKLCSEYVCKKAGVNGVEDFGYGKGYTYLEEEFKKMLKSLDTLIAANINVVILAHAQMRKFEQPDEMGAYDRWEMKLSKKCAPLVKEWVDILLFANYKTYVIEDSKTKSKKAQGGKRIMYTTHNPCWDAKNRYGLDDCLPFDFEQIKSIVEPSKPKAKKPANNEAADTKVTAEEPKKPKQTSRTYRALHELMEKAQITDDEIQMACASKKFQDSKIPVSEYPDDFIQSVLIDKWSGFCKYIKNNKDIMENPFINHIKTEV